MPRVLIVGGGITGLTAAYNLQKAARAAASPLEIVLLEQQHRLGGKVQTELTAGLTIEQGPDSFLARKPWLQELCQELGLPLIGMNTNLGKTYFLHKGRLVALPVGMQMMIPTQIGAFLSTPLLSSAGKLRAALDAVLPRRRAAGDESMGAFIQRRFGTELLDQIAAPLLAGIYAGDPYDLSLAATFPMFADMELQHRSLILGARRQATGAAAPGAAPRRVAGRSSFQTVATGLHSLVDALVAAMPGVQVELGATVVRVARDHGWRVQLAGGRELAADSLVLATPAYASARLLQPVAPGAAQELAAIPYNSALVVSLAYRPSEVAHPLDAAGFLVPRREHPVLTAATWVTAKWPHTTDGQLVHLRGYLGRSGQADPTALSDSAAVAAFRTTLCSVMGIAAAPALTRVYRWPRALPQYRVGHLERVARIRRQVATMPGLHVAGAAFTGAGLPDCVRAGREAAQQVAEQFAWPRA